MVRLDGVAQVDAEGVAFVGASAEQDRGPERTQPGEVRVPIFDRGEDGRQHRVEMHALVEAGDQDGDVGLVERGLRGRAGLACMLHH